MTEGRRYREYLEERPPAGAKRIRVMVRAKKAPSVEDLAGIWDDGQIMSKEEQYRRIVNSIRAKKQNQGDTSGFLRT